MNIRNLVVLFLILKLVLPTYATVPEIEPIDLAFGRFCKELVPQYDELSRELRTRLSKDGQQSAAENLDVLVRYSRNINADDIPGVQRTLSDGGDDVVATWFRRLAGDLIGFRRTADRLLVESLAKNQLQVDKAFLDKLKKYWDDEEYFSWRFSHEADRRVKPKTPDMRSEK